MERWLIGYPWWVGALLAGLPVGLLFGLVPLRGGGGSIALGVTAGLVTAAVMSPGIRRRHRQLTSAVDHLSKPELRREAMRASRRGPVPARPDVRAAALELARLDLAEQDRRRTAQYVVGGVAVVVLFGSAVTWLPWTVVGMVLMLLVIVWNVFDQRRLRRRVPQLRSTTSPR